MDEAAGMIAEIADGPGDDQDHGDEVQKSAHGNFVLGVTEGASNSLPVRVGGRFGADWASFWRGLALVGVG